MSDVLKNILVVDDEEKIVEVIKSYLENGGYKVYTAFTGHAALDAFERANPSLVILDLMLPDISGEAVCKIIREKSRVPIIMLTAKVEEENILEGLDTGADDYVTKPFSPRQLMARIAALLRRSEDGWTTKSSDSYELIIDTAKREITLHGEAVNLTPIEYKLLTLLAKHPSKAFNRDELITMVMGADFDGYDRTIDVHIKNLRQKIETDPKNPKYILTVHGVGYKFGGTP